MKANMLGAIVVSFLVAACDPFRASGQAVDEEIVVRQADVAKIELLTPSRRLPSSAHNVRMKVMHFQDTAFLVRFEANADEARTFAERLVGKPLNRTDFYPISKRHPDWWITKKDLSIAEWARDDVVDGDGLPYSSVAVVSNKDGRATVWVHTWTG